MIADSALYVQNKLLNAFYVWITRVPENIKLVKQLVESDEQDFAWQVIQDGYKGVWLGQDDRGMRQHWGLFYSEQANKRETITFESRIEKALVAAEKNAKKLEKEPFNCEKDAERAVNSFENKLKYHKLS